MSKAGISKIIKIKGVTEDKAIEILIEIEDIWV